MGSKKDKIENLKNQLEEELQNLAGLKEEGKSVDQLITEKVDLLNNLTDTNIDQGIEQTRRKNLKTGISSDNRSENNGNDLEKKLLRVSEELENVKSKYKGLIVGQRRQKAEISRLRNIVNHYEKDDAFTDRVVNIVRNAIESLPIIEPSPTHVPDLNKKEESMLLLLSDSHVGKKTKSYNSKVFAKRLNVLKEGLFDIADMHRKIRKVDKLYIVFNGDMIDAEAIYPGQSVDNIDAVILDQIFTIGLPNFTKFLLDCASYFPYIECRCVMGNHGRQKAAELNSSKSTNWDLVLYKALEATLVEQNRIKWFISVKDWKNMFKIYDEGFLATHGDQIKMQYNIPHYGMTRQAGRWALAYRKKITLTHFLFGHFHSLTTGMGFNQLNIYTNGSFVTDDPFSEKYIGVASIPEQLLLGVHPSKGVSWRYPMHLD